MVAAAAAADRSPCAGSCFPAALHERTGSCWLQLAGHAVSFPSQLPFLPSSSGAPLPVPG